MLDKQLRYVKEDVLTPVARTVGEHFTPTQLTLIGGVIGIGAAVAGWQGMYVLGLGLWLVNRVFDGLDGAVARLFNKQSDIGAYIDIMVDATVYALVPIGLALAVNEQSVYIALTFMLGAFYVNMASWTYLSSLLEKRNRGASTSGEMTSVTMPDGLIEGTETIVFYTLFFLLPSFLTWLFVIMGIMIVITILQRMVWALDHLD
ncbi:MAG: CDP-alcohol phosphatidyltransferase family protein [Chloroflexota bacterium]